MIIESDFGAVLIRNGWISVETDEIICRMSGGNHPKYESIG
jgi:hypothetical protein